MNRLISYLKGRNRILLELCTGILLLGAVLWAVGAVILLFVEGSEAVYGLSILLGVLTALVSASDMYRTLDKAMDLGERGAPKAIYGAYLKRYVIVGVILALTCVSDHLHPVIFAMAYLTLKGGAYLQPWTHRRYNHLFGETDPIPRSLEEIEEEQRLAAEAAKAAEDAAEEIQPEPK